MLKKFRDKIALSGITVLCIGITLLIFTFFSAYGFLTTDLSPISTQDLVQTFGEALGPLIAAAIHIMYLGVMGWISSLITMRGVTILTHVPQPPQDHQMQLQEPKLQSQQRKTETRKSKKRKNKPAEPEMIVIPQEEMEQQTQRRKKTKRSP